MTLIPAPNLDIAKRVWHYMRTKQARPCGGLFVRLSDGEVIEYFKSLRGIEDLDKLLKVGGGGQCAVFVTLGLGYFERYLQHNLSHRWWEWFGSELILPQVSPTADTLAEAVLSIGISVVGDDESRYTAAFRSSKISEWYREDPWPVIDWFGIDISMVPYVKLTSEAEARTGAACSLRDMSTPEIVRDALRDFVASPEFRRLCV